MKIFLAALLFCSVTSTTVHASYTIEETVSYINKLSDYIYKYKPSAKFGSRIYIGEGVNFTGIHYDKKNNAIVASYDVGAWVTSDVTYTLDKAFYTQFYNLAGLQSVEGAFKRVTNSTGYNGVVFTCPIKNCVYGKGSGSYVKFRSSGYNSTDKTYTNSLSFGVRDPIIAEKLKNAFQHLLNMAVAEAKSNDPF